MTILSFFDYVILQNRLQCFKIKRKQMDTEKKTNGFLSPEKNPAEVKNEEWKKVLPKEVYHIAREKGHRKTGNREILST